MGLASSTPLFPSTSANRLALIEKKYNIPKDMFLA